MGVGILGIGTYLPPTVRKNDFWPRHTIEKWADKGYRHPGKGGPKKPDNPKYILQEKSTNGKRKEPTD